MKHLIVFFAAMMLIACSEEKKERITNSRDYDSFLDTANNETTKNAQSEINFWSNRIKNDSSGLGELGPLASAYTTMFTATGELVYLIDAETVYKRAIAIAARNKDSYERALSRNWISQHRFEEAKNLLEKSYSGISNKRATEMMLFDVYMELGDYEKANFFLEKVKNNKDYNYLIRLSKWCDHKGDLDLAIKYLEQAKLIAESRNSTSLRVWTYSNLGDYYSHNGMLERAYQYYIETMQLQPDNAYVKKQIARIAYTYDSDLKEATRIVDSVMKTNNAPDSFLLKAEIAKLEGNLVEANMYENTFIEKTSNIGSTNMYASYLIDLYVSKDPEEALRLAHQEVISRSTPNSYSYLAFAQLKNGNRKEALLTIEKYEVEKSFEPIALYHTALIYKANNMNSKVKSIKKELIKSSFELGPVLTQEILKL